MDFERLVNERYSVRKYASTPVEEDKLQQIFESARKAPSAVNFQPYKLYVVQDAENLEKIKECYHRSWIKTAPVIIAVVALHDMSWKRGVDAKDHADIDAAIVSDYLMLQAAELGLGTCWVCNFDVEAVRDMLKLKSTDEPIALIPLGYPENTEVPVKKRKGVDDIFVRI